MTQLTALPDRGVLSLSGADRVGFLQGLVSNDVTLAAPGRAIWAALLTPQGKYLADFFIFAAPAMLLLEMQAARLAIVAQKLARLRLRADVALQDVSASWHVHAAWADRADAAPDLPHGALAAPDPRLPEAGWRVLTPEPLAATTTPDAYDRHRLALGLPDGLPDLEPDKTILLEANFDVLNGISWTKGCYMGQELTARTRYRGLIKRRLLPVEADGDLPPPGTPILAEGAEIGTLRSRRDRRALATLRLDAIGRALSCAGVALRVDRPGWLAWPDPPPD